MLQTIFATVLLISTGVSFAQSPAIVSMSIEDAQGEIFTIVGESTLKESGDQRTEFIENIGVKAGESDSDSPVLPLISETYLNPNPPLRLMERICEKMAASYHVPQESTYAYIDSKVKAYVTVPGNEGEPYKVKQMIAGRVPVYSFARGRIRLNFVSCSEK